MDLYILLLYLNIDAFLHILWAFPILFFHFSMQPALHKIAPITFIQTFRVLQYFPITLSVWMHFSTFLWNLIMRTYHVFSIFRTFVLYLIFTDTMKACGCWLVCCKSMFLFLLSYAREQFYFCALLSVCSCPLLKQLDCCACVVFSCVCTIECYVADTPDTVCLSDYEEIYLDETGVCTPDSYKVDFVFLFMF
jgi:hypothetical protein